MSSRASSTRQSAHGRLLTDVILLIFRVNGQLMASGDRLVADLPLTGARWQMLGAIALSGSARTAPQLGAQMGVTRQGAQKQLDLLLEGGLVDAQPNPGHARSPLYLLSKKGISVYAEAENLQITWANQLAHRLRTSDLETARELLEEFSGRLAADTNPESTSRRRPQ